MLQGALSGLATGIILLLWITIGALSVKVIHIPLPTYNHMCNSTVTSLVMSMVNTSTVNPDNMTSPWQNHQSSGMNNHMGINTITWPQDVTYSMKDSIDQINNETDDRYYLIEYHLNEVILIQMIKKIILLIATNSL